MEAIQHIIIDDTLSRIGNSQLAGYLCHAYCHAGHCTFERNGKKSRMEQGDCLIIPRRGDLVRNLQESADFAVDVIYVTQEFIEISTPRSNYGMKGHLALFENPIMKLNPEQQARCANNFAVIRQRLAQPQHHFYRDVLTNAVQTMILDFFDFHAEMYGEDKISSQNDQLMSQFIEMLEQGDYRKNRDIAYYADKLCITPKYLSEVSKKVSGLPANYWITRYTSLDISRLLRDRSLTFTDIADMFGFSSPAHFSRYVQNNLGAKPSDLR
ncbi:MAG: AraC family transcriptional regulator [Prevotella sp.]|nr:AraC family transcriptional regulator [Prevotella sp.]